MNNSFFFGYATIIRGLREDDVIEHDIDMGDSRIEDCLAVDGEDLARALGAVVDARTARLVWSAIPVLDGSADPDEADIVDQKIEPEEAEPFVTAVVFASRVMFPDVDFPISRLVG